MERINRRFNFKSVSQNLKIISASAVCLTTFLTGCSILNNINETDTKVTENEPISYSSSEISVSNPDETFNAESEVNVTESSDITEPIITEEVHNFELTDDEKDAFLEEYFDRFNFQSSGDISDKAFWYSPFMFDEEMRSAFVQYYNNLKGTNYTYVSKYEMQELLVERFWEPLDRSQFYLKDAYNEYFENQVFEHRWSGAYSDGFNDNLINSYLALNNLPANHIFTIEEIQQYLPNVDKGNAYSYMYELYEKSPSAMNLTVSEYMGAIMINHNGHINKTSFYSWIDIETFEGEFADKAKDSYINAYNANLSAVSGKEENVDPFAPITPEIFKEIYGYEPLDVSKEAIEGYTCAEYVESYQKSR